MPKIYINFPKFRKTPRVIIVCRIKDEFVWILQFPGCWGAFELKRCVQIEWTFFVIAPDSTDICAQRFRLIRRWGKYMNGFLVCRTVFAHVYSDTPFRTIHFHRFSFVFRFWRDEWRKVVDAHHHLKSIFLCGKLCCNCSNSIWPPSNRLNKLWIELLWRIHTK